VPILTPPVHFFNTSKFRSFRLDVSILTDRDDRFVVIRISLTTINVGDPLLSEVPLLTFPDSGVRGGVYKSRKKRSS